MTAQVGQHVDRALDLVMDIDRLEDDLDVLLSMTAEETMAPPDGFFRPAPEELIEPLTEASLAKKIGDRVRSLREEHNMTQKDLSNRCGILRPNIARLESGSNLPSLSTLLKISGGLEIPLGFLLP